MINFERLDNIILNYLEEPKTDYAILLNGEWGSGKTFYLKKHLVDYLQEKKKEIKPIYVSLFGVKDSNDLSKKILIQLFPILGHKISKTAGALSKIALSSLGISIGDGKPSEVLDAIGKVDQNTLILFDDLERLDPEILIEIIGYINQFVEHEGVKAVIAANESEIKELNEGDTKFRIYLEKIIRYTINFNVPFNETSKEIYDTYEIMHEIRSHIDRAFQKSSNKNLRTLQFICSVSQHILKQIPTGRYSSKVEEMAIYFASFVAIEIKSSAMTIDEAKELSTYSLTVPISALFDDLENLEAQGTSSNKKKLVKKNPSRSDKLFDKYFDSGRLMYFESIIDYLFTGFLDTDKFKHESELCAQQIEKEYGTEEHRSWQRLIDYLLLEEVELGPLIEEVLSYADEGVYSLDIYYSAFGLIRRLNRAGLSKVSEKSLCNRLSHGLQKTDAGGFNLDLFDEPDKDDKYLTKLYRKVLEHKTRLTIRDQEDLVKQHIGELFTNPDRYYQEYYNRDSAALPNFNTFLTEKDFIEKFDALPNHSKNVVCKIFYSRTPDRAKFTKAELKWTRKLKDKLESSLKKEKRSIARLNKERLVRAVNNVLEKWKTSEMDLED